MEELGGHVCPVCGYDGLPTPAWRSTSAADDLICWSCGVQYGYDDSSPDEAGRAVRHAELRDRWIADGCPWKFRDPPLDWNPEEQLERLRWVGASVSFELLDFDGAVAVLTGLIGRLISVVVIGDSQDSVRGVNLAQLAGRLQRRFPQPGGSVSAAYFELGEPPGSGFHADRRLFVEARLKDWRGMTNGRSLEIHHTSGMMRVFAPQPEILVGAGAHPQLH